jgi:hypothetical protein
MPNKSKSPGWTTNSLQAWLISIFPHKTFFSQSRYHISNLIKRGIFGAPYLVQFLKNLQHFCTELFLLEQHSRLWIIIWMIFFKKLWNFNEFASAFVWTVGNYPHLGISISIWIQTDCIMRFSPFCPCNQIITSTIEGSRWHNHPWAKCH